MELYEEESQVKTREDFITFVHHLAQDLQDHHEEWQNGELSLYLEGLANAAVTVDRYYENTERELPQNPTWEMFAGLLLTAKIYE